MTSAIKWEPIEDLKAIRDTLGCMVARSAGRAPLPKWLGIHPPMDLEETGEAFVAEVDLPGVQAEDIDVTVRGSKLTVEGKRARAAAEEGSASKRVHCERPTGTFSRTWTIPGTVDLDAIVARLDRGVLTVTMPKRAAARAVQIEITHPPEPAEA